MATLAFDFIKVERPPESPEAGLERSYIIEYLAGKGYTLRDLLKMPAHLARKLRIEASVYASSKLAELETRSRLVSDLHGGK
jgi:hypothetical protein